MTDFTFDENLYSDLHKDTYGFRPFSNDEFYDRLTTPERKQEIWDQTLVDFARAQEQQAEQEAEAELRFQKLITDTLALGAPTTEIALRWIFEGEEFTEHDMMYGASYVAYHFGLSYQNRWKEIIQQTLDQLIKEIREDGTVAAN